jgi:hypothetical protein
MVGVAGDTVLSVVVTHLEVLPASRDSGERRDSLLVDFPVAEITAVLVTVVSADVNATFVIVAFAILMRTTSISASLVRGGSDQFPSPGPLWASAAGEGGAAPDLAIYSTASVGAGNAACRRRLKRCRKPQAADGFSSLQISSRKPRGQLIRSRIKRERFGGAHQGPQQTARALEPVSRRVGAGARPSPQNGGLVTSNPDGVVRTPGKQQR